MVATRSERARHSQRRAACGARSLTGLAALGVVALLGAACDQGSGFVRGDRLTVESCRGVGVDRTFEPFTMGLAFMGAEREDGVVMIRLAPEGGQPHELDQLVITVEGYEALRAEIAEAGAATRPLLALATASPGREQVEAGLVLLQRCSTTLAPLRAIGGEVTFSHLGATRGERVAGSMRFELMDDRSGEIVGFGFVAEFDFEVAIGQPSRTFSPATSR